MTIRFDTATATCVSAGPVLTRQMSDLEGLFADHDEWVARSATVEVVYTVHSSPVPEKPRELPQSVTTILPGEIGAELFMTNGHQHPNP